MPSDREEEIGFLPKIEKWWKSNQNSQQNESFKRMALPTQKITMTHRELVTKYNVYRSINNVWSMFMTSRFELSYKIRLGNVSVLDLYYGQERQLKLENRTSSDHGGLSNCTKFEFIDLENPRFAICAFHQQFHLFLSVLEVDLEGGKLVIHQLQQIEFQDHHTFVTHLILDRQAIVSNTLSKHWIALTSFTETYIQFQLEIMQDTEIPRIVPQGSLRENRRELRNACALINQQVYSFHYDNLAYEASRSIYEQMAVRDTSAPLNINGERPQTIIKLHGYRKEFKGYRELGRILSGNRVYFAYRDETKPEAVILCLDLKHRIWIDFFRLKIDRSDISFNFSLTTNELLLKFTEKHPHISSELEVHNYTLFPIGRPFLLIKMCIFTMRFLNQTTPVYDPILQRLNLFSEIRPLDGAQKCKSVYDRDFRQFCREFKVNYYFSTN